MSDTPTPGTDDTEKIADKLGSPAASYGFTLARLKETERELTYAQNVAEILWGELDKMTKKYIGKRAPSPPKLPWKFSENPPTILP